MALFQFYVPYLKNSLILVFFIILPFIRNETLVVFFSIVKNKKLISSILLSLIPPVYSISMTILSGVMDFSFYNKVILLIIYVPIISLLVSIFETYEINKNIIIKSFFIALSIQVLIIILAVFNKDFLSFVRFFQYPDAVIRLETIGADVYRGFSLSGPLFFGMASALVFLLFCLFAYEVNNRNRAYMYLVLSVFAVIFCTVARTMLIFHLAIFIYLFSRLSLSTISKIFKFLIICIVFLISIYIYVYNFEYSLIEKLDGINKFMFEILYNYFDSGSISSKSTDELQGMYFPLSFDTFLFGDWRYSDQYGLAYMRTDAGYMRNTLLFGAPMIIFLALSEIILLKGVARYFSNGYKIEYYRLLGILSFIIFLLHYKGESLIYSFPLHMSIFMFFILGKVRVKN